MINYYKVYNPATSKIEYWKGATSNASWLLNSNNFIIPLGTHKPKNIPASSIKQF